MKLLPESIARDIVKNSIIIADELSPNLNPVAERKPNIISSIDRRMVKQCPP